MAADIVIPSIEGTIVGPCHVTTAEEAAAEIDRLLGRNRDPRGGA